MSTKTIKFFIATLLASQIFGGVIFGKLVTANAELVEVRKTIDEFNKKTEDVVVAAIDDVTEEYTIEPIEVSVIEEVVPEPSIEVVEEVPIVDEPVIQAVNYNFDVFQPSNISTEQASNVLAGTGLSHLASAFVDAEQQYGVNSIYLMATMGLESGWGKFKSANNNIAGWTNGKGGYRSFPSEYDCIMYVARNIEADYKPRVGNTLVGVTTRYCPEPGYTTKVSTIINELQSKI